MSVRKAQSSLKTLVDLGLVIKKESERPGQPHTYTLAENLSEMLESPQFQAYKRQKEQKLKDKERKRKSQASKQNDELGEPGDEISKHEQ